MGGVDAAEALKFAVGLFLDGLEVLDGRRLAESEQGGLLLENGVGLFEEHLFSRGLAQHALAYRILAFGHRTYRFRVAARTYLLLPLLLVLKFLRLILVIFLAPTHFLPLVLFLQVCATRPAAARFHSNRSFFPVSCLL